MGRRERDERDGWEEDDEERSCQVHVPVEDCVRSQTSLIKMFVETFPP